MHGAVFTMEMQHYVTIYGFESTKLFLVSEGHNSLKLIKEYYEDEKKS